MSEKTERRIFPLISLETGEIIIEDKRDGMTVTSLQAQLLSQLDLIAEYADELPMIEREVLMRKHCIGAYIYGINTFSEIAKEMNLSKYLVKKAYIRAIRIIKDMLFK